MIKNAPTLASALAQCSTQLAKSLNAERQQKTRIAKLEAALGAFVEAEARGDCLSLDEFMRWRKVLEK